MAGPDLNPPLKNGRDGANHGQGSANQGPGGASHGRDGGDHTSAQAELLANADLFAGLDRVTLAKLAANLDRVVHADGEAACVQGDVGDSLFLVSEGRFDVFVHRQDGTRDERVASLGRGACFGEMALLTGEPRSAGRMGRRQRSCRFLTSSTSARLASRA